VYCLIALAITDKIAFLALFSSAATITKASESFIFNLDFISLIYVVSFNTT